MCCVPIPCRAVDRIDDLLSKIVQYAEDVMVSVVPSSLERALFSRLEGSYCNLLTHAKYID